MQKQSASVFPLLLLTTFLIGSPQRLLGQYGGPCSQPITVHHVCNQQDEQGHVVCTQGVDTTFCNPGYSSGQYCSVGFGVACCNTTYPSHDYQGPCSSGGGGDQPMLFAREARSRQLSHRIYLRSCSGGVERLDTLVLKDGIGR